MALIDALKEETKNLLMSQDLKTKSSSMSIGFNVPKEPKTTIRVGVYLGGEEASKLNNEMRSAMGANDADIRDGLAEFRIGVKAGTAVGHAKNLQSLM